jgi:hypothetical protein
MDLDLVEKLNIESSSISEASYYPNVRRLFVTFRSGKEYEYFNVPEHVVNEFRYAPSKGKFLKKHIIACYKFKKVQLLYTPDL